MRRDGLVLLLLLLTSTFAPESIAGLKHGLHQQPPRLPQRPTQQQQQQQQLQRHQQFLLQQRLRQQQPKKPACGGLQQTCCPACTDGTSDADCTRRECRDGNTCYMFAQRDSAIPDGTTHFPMLCLDSPEECGEPGQPCCYVSDPTSESGRCNSGLTCIAQGSIGYSSLAMYNKLLKDPSLVRSTEVMGVCKKLTPADCGKLWHPCGAAARRIGCNESEVTCQAGAFCASPGDTMLAAPRCLPLPLRCGQQNNACCPANKDSTTRERWLQDGTTAVPYCTDGKSFCVWQYKDYSKFGLNSLSSGAGSRTLLWDGYFERGYGVSRCAPLPAACGNPGEPCCPSMIDQRLSGMVHNRQFKFQPCNYRASGKLGIYCDGAWRSELLKPGVKLGTCTLNTPDCGKVGKKCCMEDVARVDPVGLCEEGQRPGLHYCTRPGNICTRCPKVLKTPDQKESCMGVSGPPFDLESPVQQQQQQLWQKEPEQEEQQQEGPGSGRPPVQGPAEGGSSTGFTVQWPQPQGQGEAWSTQWPQQQQQQQPSQQQQQQGSGSQQQQGSGSQQQQGSGSQQQQQQQGLGSQQQWGPGPQQTGFAQQQQWGPGQLPQGQQQQQSPLQQQQQGGGQQTAPRSTEAWQQQPELWQQQQQQRQQQDNTEEDPMMDPEG